MERFGAPVYVPEEDASLVSSPDQGALEWMGYDFKGTDDFSTLRDGDVLTVGSMKVILATPGHTPGSSCYLAEAGGRESPAPATPSSPGVSADGPSRWRSEPLDRSILKLRGPSRRTAGSAGARTGDHHRRREETQSLLAGRSHGGMKLAALPGEEWPRERLRRRGAASLSLAELLAVLLRTGSKGKDVLELASELLKEFGNAQGLSRATEEEMLSFPGLGEAKACVLLAALELGKRIRSEKTSTRTAHGRSVFPPGSRACAEERGRAWDST